MKFFVFAIDDGTVFDKNVIAIFNKYGIKATFNLNSGLQDFVWFKDWLEVRRLRLEENKDIYDGHEVASHSLTHPFLTSLSDEGIYREVKEDIDNLRNIFQRDITSFSFPFDGFDERSIGIIKNLGITHIILPAIDDSFRRPADTYHIKVTSWDIDDALVKAKRFIEDDQAEMFVYLSHSYDYEYAGNYDKLEKLCQIVSGNQDIKIINVKDI
ncbi:MAG: polysaccharide deacetylase family protein [Bacilli bacterium]|nr:polysaccharide deacetylase family protein [Bacilli bacterium]